MRPLARLCAPILLASLVVAFAACGGGGDKKSATSTPGGDTTPAATKAATTATAGATSKSALDTFDTFHYEVAIKLELNDDSGGLTGNIEGDYVSPGNHSATQQFDVAGLSRSIAVVIIGSDAWTKGATDWKKTTSTDPEVVSALSGTAADPEFFPPTSFVEALADLPFEVDTLDGRGVRRYKLTKDEIKLLGSAIGGAIISDSDLDKVKEFSGLALVDDDEEVVTGFEAKFVGPSAEAESGAVKPGDPGDTATITVSMKLTRINDPSIKVEPPI